MRVLIADDHAVFRRGLKETIGEAFPKVTFGEAKTADEALACVRQHDWEIVILDISMPGKSGLDILSDLKRLRPKLPVLFLSMYPEEQYARRALKAGASGYLTKDSVPEELKTAVRRVLSGGRYVSVTLAERLAYDLRRGADTPVQELLSDRRRTLAQRQNREHVSFKDFGENRNENHRGADPVCPAVPTGGLRKPLRVVLRRRGWGCGTLALILVWHCPT